MTHSFLLTKNLTYL